MGHRVFDSSRRLTEMHIFEARKRAISLFSFGSSVYPEEWDDAVVEPIVSELFEFGFHARRINELCSVNVGEDTILGYSRYNLTAGGPNKPELNYEYILNSLTHCRDFRFHWAIWTGDKRFLTSSKEVIPCYVSIDTDKFYRVEFYICGVALCFLNVVIPLIKKKFPSYRF